MADEGAFDGVDAAMKVLEGRNETNSPAHLKVVKI